MNNNDFLTAIETFNKFIDSQIKEFKENLHSYPLGIGVHGEKIHFSYHKDFKLNRIFE